MVHDITNIDDTHETKKVYGSKNRILRQMSMKQLREAIKQETIRKRKTRDTNTIDENKGQ
jgi:hypothetical protein